MWQFEVKSVPLVLWAEILCEKSQPPRSAYTARVRLDVESAANTMCKQTRGNSI